jgi:hypothetical protein
MQLTTSRYQAIVSKETKEEFLNLLPTKHLESLQAGHWKKNPYYPQASSTVQESSSSKGQTLSSTHQDIESNTNSLANHPFYQSDDYLPVEKMLLPLLPKEECVHRFNGGLHYRPCCLLPHCVPKLTLPYCLSPRAIFGFCCPSSNATTASNPDHTLSTSTSPFHYLCNFTMNSPALDAVSSWFTCTQSRLVKILTCWSRPLQVGHAMVITDRTFFFTQYSSREGYQSASDKPPLFPYSEKIHRGNEEDSERDKERDKMQREKEKGTIGSMEDHPCASVLCSCCFYDNYGTSTTSSSNVPSATGTSASSFSSKAKDPARGCCQCFGAPSRYRLEPFFIAWVPIGSITDQEVNIINRGNVPTHLIPLDAHANDYQTNRGAAESLTPANGKVDPSTWKTARDPTPGCCELRPQNPLSRYVLTVNTDVGLSFAVSDHMEYKAWTKDRRLMTMQDVIGAIQQQQTHNEHTVYEQV